MRLKARKDANHNAIAALFAAAGCSVADTSQLGRGFPDMLVGLCGINVLVEVKDGGKVPSKQKLTPDEFLFFDRWKGWVAIVRDDKDALNIINQIKQERAQQMRGFAAMQEAKA